MNGKTFFEVRSKLGKLIRTTDSHWRLITEHKHLEIKGKEKQIIKTLQQPSEIRLSKKDNNVYLYYRKVRQSFYCVVVRHFNGEGFVITAYLSKNIKEGEKIWKK